MGTQADKLTPFVTAVTTTLAAGAAGCVNLFLTYAQTHTWDLLACCNGLLAGLVSITSGCPVVEPWAALIAGSIGAVIFNYSCKLLDALRIDDPLAAAPMHGFCGAWGVFFVGLFAKGDYVAQAYGNSLDAAKGAFYGGDGSLLGVNILGIIMITLWVGGMLGALFFGLNMMGLLRVDQSMELAGLDVSKHGGSAYNMAEEALKDGPVVSAEH